VTSIPPLGERAHRGLPDGDKLALRLEGFRPITGSLAQASFAAPDHEEETPAMPSLRVVRERR
jgi:hypothetical protein